LHNSLKYIVIKFIRIKNGVLKELFGYAAIIRNREWMQRFLE
jgi:hypothetical protein